MDGSTMFPPEDEPNRPATGQTDTDKAMRKGRIPMRETEADRKVATDVYNVTADELRQFIERFEQLESEKKDVNEQQKELMAEAKGRGYDTKVMKKVIVLRRRKPDEIAEEEALMDMYKAAMGMQ